MDTFLWVGNCLVGDLDGEEEEVNTVCVSCTLVVRGGRHGSDRATE